MISHNVINLISIYAISSGIYQFAVRKKKKEKKVVSKEGLHLSVCAFLHCSLSGS